MTALSPHAVPRLRRGIRRQFDAARGQNVLLGPERVILLDDIGNAIAELCDSEKTIAEICSTLAERYAAAPAEVTSDVMEFIAEMQDKGLVTA